MSQVGDRVDRLQKAMDRLGALASSGQFQRRDASARKPPGLFSSATLTFGANRCPNSGNTLLKVYAL